MAVNPYAALIPQSGEILRPIASGAWVSGGQLNFDLPRGNDIASYIVEVTGTTTLSTAATTVSSAAPAQMISSITIKADGSKNIENTSGLQAACSNFERSLARTLVAPGVGTTTQTIYAQYRLDRITPDSFRPKDSAMHTSQNYMGSLQMQINMGTVAAMYSSFGSGVVGSTAVTVNVYQQEIQEGAESGATEFKFIRRHSNWDQTPSGAQSSWIILLPTNTYFRGVKIMTLNSTTNEPSDGLLTNAIIRSGNNNRLNLTGAMLHSVNQGAYQLQTTQLSAIAGNYYIDLLQGQQGSRSLKSLWSLWAASDCTLELNLASGSRILVQSINYDMQPALPTDARVAAMRGQARVRQAVNAVASGAPGTR